MICVVVLPSSDLLSGRLHRRGDVFLYSRSPLSEPVSIFVFLLLVLNRLKCRGEYTG